METAVKRLSSLQRHQLSVSTQNSIILAKTSLPVSARIRKLAQTLVLTRSFAYLSFFRLPIYGLYKLISSWASFIRSCGFITL